MMHPTQRNTSARRSATVRDGAPASDTKSLPARPKKVRFAHDEPRDVRGHHRDESKASRAPTSPLDAAWGTLFRPTGDPTRRMGDILRGLATYLIETFPPNGSLVLEPDRMRRFYRHYRQRREGVDWERLFAMSNRSLETLYLALQCDYHLVQAPGASPRRAASLPALTPQGFAHWSALMLSAFPDNEARRLQDVVADLPLEAVPQGLGQGPGPGPGQGHGQGGGLRSPRERLPRRISRCLLPDRAHPDTLRLVLRALSGLADAPARCSDRHETRPYNRGADAITVEEDGGRRRSFTCTRPGFEGEQRGHDGGRRLSQPRYQEARDAAAKWWHPTRPPRYPPEKWKDGGRWADEV